MNWMAVAVGGALGAVARHGVNQLIHVRESAVRFPLGTAAINVSGCFVIGLLAGLVASDRLVLRASIRGFVFVGLLGGFTTFSSFGLETLALARQGSPGAAVANVALQVVGGLSAVWLGLFLAGRSS